MQGKDSSAHIPETPKVLVNLHIPILVDSLLSRFIPPLSLSLPLPFFVAVVLLLKECPSFLGAFFKDSVLSVSLPAPLISLYFPHSCSYLFALQHKLQS